MLYDKENRMVYTESDPRLPWVFGVTELFEDNGLKVQKR